MRTGRLQGYRRSAGFTLVEIMIAVLIGLIGIVVIMQVYAVSEGYKRSATSGTDAQVNGAIGLYQIERDLRVAAYGISALMNPTGNVTQACTSIRMWNSNLNRAWDMKVTPFEINPAGIPAGDANTDVIAMIYGNADSAVIGTFADQGGSPTRYFDIRDNWNGYRNGDLIVSYSPTGGPGNTPICALHELTAVPSGSGNCGSPVSGAGGKPWLGHDPVTYGDPNNNCQPKTATHNNATGIPMANGQPVPALSKGTGGQIYNLGALPSWKAYAIRGGNLTTCDLMVQDCGDLTQWQIIAQDVVGLRAIYATAGAAGPQWTRNAITTIAQANSISGIAVALIARSPLKEKSSTGAAACDTTANAGRPDRGQANAWYQQYMGATDGTITAAAFDLSSIGADWQCYRYKLFQTAVPIRNLMWRP